jgi:penicillin-binding protein 2
MKRPRSKNETDEEFAAMRQQRLMPFQGWRLQAFTVLMVIAFVLLILRLYYLQVEQFDELNAAARENAVQALPLPAPRGVIYDRNGKPLALNAPAFNVSIIPAELPEELSDTLKVLNRLSALIDVPPTRAAAIAANEFVRSLQELVQDGQSVAPYRPVVVASDVDEQIAKIILQDLQNLPGVRVEAVSVRQYPSGSLTSQIIGYLGPIGQEEADALREQGYNPAFERVGYAGVENYLEDDLAGKRGLLTQIVDVAGSPINIIRRDPPQPGRSVRLTLDLDLQLVAEQQLQDRINILNAQAGVLRTISGVVIAMNPQTGEILAMVSLPTYNNQRFARAIDGEYYTQIANAPQTPLVNHAIQSLYPPGSVWKLLSAAGILQENVIDPNRRLFDGGELFVENSFAANDVAQRQRFVCWDKAGHGQVDMIQAIAWSCDIYFYQVGGGNPDPALAGVIRPGGLGIEDMYRYSTAFFVGVDTGVELPYENPGQMPDRSWKRRVYGESWSTGDTYNAAFGQGYVTITPLQQLGMTVALANGGVYYQPTLIKEWLDSEGKVVEPFTPKVSRTITFPTDGSMPILNMREDMLIQGKNSLTCVCEPRSPYRNKDNPEYDPNMPECTQDFVQNYTAKVNSVEYGEFTYKVHVPYGYIFGGMCNQRQINDGLYANYQPPFVSRDNISIIEQGMLAAVVAEKGTASKAALGYVTSAGKTGTAEYCDNIAAGLNLCRPGKWPKHAWYVGYAPFENAEIAVVAFVYNAEQGSFDALPIVRNVIDCYFRQKQERLRLGNGVDLPPCNISQ